MPVSGLRAATGRSTTVERVPLLDRAPPIDVAERLRALGGLALLESARPGRRAGWTYLSADPLAVLDTVPAEGDPFTLARAALDRLDRRPHVSTETGPVPPFSGGLCGYLGYDLGRRLERPGRPPPGAADARDRPDLPELRLALHDWVLAWERSTGHAWISVRVADGDVARAGARREAVLKRALTPLAQGSAPEAAPPPFFRSNLDQDAFAARVLRIQDHIAAGDVYQVNLARRLEAPFTADPWPLYRRLRTGDPATYAAYLDLGRASGAGPPRGPRALLSASPEPFLRLDARGGVSSDPIKGTRARGRTRVEDRALAAELLASEKDRAENTMIVDVLRNDLGRVCEPGSVRVSRLCRLERTAAVQHLVSTVQGDLAPGRDAFDLLCAAFPGGSITGAPKIRAMELIAQLEPAARGPYTGAALWVDAAGAMGSSILIRTLVADGDQLTLHVGGGITWRSDPVEEWRETEAKAHGPLGALGAAEVA